MAVTVSARFWAKVIRAGPDECWLWNGSTNQDGYGTFSYQGRNEKAHRVAVLLDGRCIHGVVIRHRCDNPRCVNPAHLLTGTHGDNVRDRDSRGRGRWLGKKGMANSTSKLSDDTVRQLRDAYAKLPRFPSGRIKQGALASLAKQFRLPYGTVRNIVDGYQWTHI